MFCFTLSGSAEREQTPPLVWLAVPGGDHPVVRALGTEPVRPTAEQPVWLPPCPCCPEDRCCGDRHSFLQQHQEHTFSLKIPGGPSQLSATNLNASTEVSLILKATFPPRCSSELSENAGRPEHMGVKGGGATRASLTEHLECFFLSGWVGSQMQRKPTSWFSGCPVPLVGRGSALSAKMSSVQPLSLSFTVCETEN